MWIELRRVCNRVFFGSVPHATIKGTVVNINAAKYRTLFGSVRTSSKAPMDVQKGSVYTFIQIGFRRF